MSEKYPTIFEDAVDLMEKHDLSEKEYVDRLLENVLKEPTLWSNLLLKENHEVLRELLGEQSLTNIW